LVKTFNKRIVETAVRELLVGLGEDANRPGLVDTPRRVANFYKEWLDSKRANMTEFVTSYDNMVIVKNIPFYSLCEHHILPFWGKAYIGYIPSKRILGLSKLVRILDKYSRRLQIQEHLTLEVADAIEEIVAPLGVMVVIEAEHLCMSMRGVEVPGARTITSCIKGVFKKEATRQEFLSLINRRDA